MKAVLRRAGNTGSSFGGESAQDQVVGAGGSLPPMRLLLEDRHDYQMSSGLGEEPEDSGFNLSALKHGPVCEDGEAAGW